MPTSSSLLSMSSCPLAECWQTLVKKKLLWLLHIWDLVCVGWLREMLINCWCHCHQTSPLLNAHIQSRKNILCWNENILLTSWRRWGRERRWRSWCPPSVPLATWTSGSRWPSCSRRTAKRWSRKSDLDGTIGRLIRLSWADSKWASDVTSLTKHSQKKHLPQMWTIWSCALLPPKCAQTALKCAKYA